MVGPDGQEDIPHREWLITFNKIVNDIKEDLKKQGREDEFVGAKVSILVSSSL
jgi:adenosine deaminase CECR1